MISITPACGLLSLPMETKLEICRLVREDDLKFKEEQVKRMITIPKTWKSGISSLFMLSKGMKDAAAAFLFDTVSSKKIESFFAVSIHPKYHQHVKTLVLDSDRRHLNMAALLVAQSLSTVDNHGEIRYQIYSAHLDINSCQTLFPGSLHPRPKTEEVPRTCAADEETVLKNFRSFISQMTSVTFVRMDADTFTRGWLQFLLPSYSKTRLLSFVAPTTPSQFFGGRGHLNLSSSRQLFPYISKLEKLAQLSITSSTPLEDRLVLPVGLTDLSVGLSDLTIKCLWMNSRTDWISFLSFTSLKTLNITLSQLRSPNFIPPLDDPHFRHFPHLETLRIAGVPRDIINILPAFELCPLLSLHCEFLHRAASLLPPFLPYELLPPFSQGFLPSFDKCLSPPHTRIMTL